MRTVFILCAILFLFSCNTDPVFTGKISFDEWVDSASSCPYFTRDEKGRPVLAYIKDISDSQSLVCMRISDDNGKTFGKILTVKPSDNVQPHGENMAKVAFRSNGECIAVWGASNANPKNKYAGLVFYAVSPDHGKSWSAARRLVPGEDNFDQRYFDLARLNDGEIGVLWLDKRAATGGESSCVFFSRTKKGKGFEGESLVSRDVCPCCRTELFVDRSGSIHASFRGIINDSIRDMVHCASHDGYRWGSTLRISEDNWVVSGCPHTGPSMCETDKGLHFAWYTGGEPSGVFYARSMDGGRSFTERDSVSGKPSAKHPQLMSFSDGRIAAVWDENVKYADKVNCRIGFQLRDAGGTISLQKFISPDSLVSEFPVILPVDTSSALVAYTVQKDGRRSIRQTRISW